MKNNLKQKKGITLIALVITIVVLLILAGVTIALLTGENGILGKATTAKSKNEESSVEEKIKLSVMYARMNTNGDTNINLDELETELNKNFNNDVNIEKKGENSSLPWRVENNGYILKIDKNGDVIRINGIELYKSNIQLLQGESETIEAELTPGITGIITWKSENESVAVVDNSGKVTAIGGGTTKIIAQIDGTEYSAFCNIEVVQKVVKIEVKDMQITKGTIANLDVVTTPNSNVEELEYKSSDENIATVDDKGCVKGVNAGETTIIITGKKTKDVTATCNVKVIRTYTSKNVSKITVDDYGKEVKDYTVGNKTYRIFYKDDEGKYGEKGTVYLKADASSADTELKSYMNTTPTENEIFEKMNVKWAKINGQVFDRVKENSAAYLADTSKWTNYVDERARYAIGAPSIEMYIDSYNQAFGTKYKTEILEGDGYQYSIDDGQTYVGETENQTISSEKNGMYLKANETASDWWLCSPNGTGWEEICFIDITNAKLSASSMMTYWGSYAISKSNAPIISLKDNVDLQIYND